MQQSSFTEQSLNLSTLLHIAISVYLRVLTFFLALFFSHSRINRRLDDPELRVTLLFPTLPSATYESSGRAGDPDPLAWALHLVYPNTTRDSTNHRLALARRFAKTIALFHEQVQSVA